MPLTKKVVELVCEKCKNGNPVTTETIQMTTQKVTKSLKIVQQDFKVSNDLAVSFMGSKVWLFIRQL